MLISILTLFPEMFQGPFDHSIIKQAQIKKLVEIEFINIRKFGFGKHHQVDDTPYGGGIGMVMRVDVVNAALQSTLRPKLTKRKIILTSAKGKIYKQSTAKEYAQLDHLIIICGHYEGVDERILNFIDEEISIGEFILTGGEIPAMMITDSVTRLLDGVLKKDATDLESFSLCEKDSNQMLLEYPHYTRPAKYEGVEVPKVLTEGNHKKITNWRMQQAKINSSKHQSQS